MIRFSLCIFGKNVKQVMLLIASGHELISFCPFVDSLYFRSLIKWCLPVFSIVKPLFRFILWKVVSKYCLVSHQIFILYLYRLMIFYFICWVKSIIPITLVLKNFLDLASGRPFWVVSISFWHACIIIWAVSYSLAHDIPGLLCFPCPSPRISHFSKEFCSL